MLLLLLLGGQVVIYDLPKELNIFKIPCLPPPVPSPPPQAEHWNRLMGCSGFERVRQIALRGSQLESFLIHSVSALHPCYWPAFSTGHLRWWRSCWRWRSDKGIFPPVVKRTPQPHLWHVHLLPRVKPGVVFRYGKPLPSIHTAWNNMLHLNDKKVSDTLWERNDLPFIFHPRCTVSSVFSQRKSV